VAGGAEMTRLLKALKSIAKRMPHPALIRLYYAWYFLCTVPRCRAARRKAGLPCLEDLNLEKLKQSDVLFVLGSGPSINRIVAARWQGIARHDTVGFNFWLFHPFVPTLYFIESLAFDESSVAYQTLLRIWDERAGDYVDTPKVVMELQRSGRQTVFDLSPECKQNLYAAYNISAVCRTQPELSASLSYLKKKGVFARSSHRNFMFKYASSVTTMLALASNMGYRKVVLCGIDLSDQDYFYQDADLYPETALLTIEPRGEKHASLVPVPFRVPADEVVLEMKRLVLDPQGIELYVESRSSKLWPRIPHAPDCLFELQGGGSEGRAVPTVQPRSHGAPVATN
jgi:hypothetical protein